MEIVRFNAARSMLDDARHLLNMDRWASAISRAYYSSYQAMWAALGTPPQTDQWRHAAIVAHFVRGYWFVPTHPKAGPGLLEPLRRPLQWLYQKRIDVDYDIKPVTQTMALRAIEIAEQVHQEIQQHSGRMAP
ncbi:MAG: HEPN domain-containing protein [Deltaproteobacteria bacterium]|nr:HEPN domain-containing protein [Deltaproteobacteria bacterium]